MVYRDINDAYSVYLQKYGILPDLLFINYSVFQELSSDRYISPRVIKNSDDYKVSEFFGKPVYLLNMKTPYLWIDKDSLDRAKVKEIIPETDEIVINLKFRGNIVDLAIPREIIDFNTNLSTF